MSLVIHSSKQQQMQLEICRSLQLSAVGNLSISNAGLGYTPADGGQTFTGVNLVTLTGHGRGATADITVRNGSIVASGATINNAGGSGYQVGDVVGIDTIGAASVGRNARLTIAGIGHTNELILNNVQGEFVVGAAKTLFFFNSSGISTELNYVWCSWTWNWWRCSNHKY